MIRGYAYSIDSYNIFGSYFFIIASFVPVGFYPTFTGWVYILYLFSLRFYRFAWLLCILRDGDPLLTLFVIGLLNRSNYFEELKTSFFLGLGPFTLFDGLFTVLRTFFYLFSVIYIGLSILFSRIFGCSINRWFCYYLVGTFIYLIGTFIYLVGTILSLCIF